MRAEQASIQSNTSYPLRDEACVLPGCHAPLAAALAAEQEMAWPSACNANVVVDCLPRLLCHFEANRLSLEACGYTKEEVIGKPFWEGPWWTPSATLVERIKLASAQAAVGQPAPPSV